jgi:hypothetical protein
VISTKWRFGKGKNTLMFSGKQARMNLIFVMKLKPFNYISIGQLKI